MPEGPLRVVNVHQAKTHLSRLIDEAHAGETIVLAKAGKPWARLMPLQPPAPQRIDAFEQLSPCDRRFIAGMFGPGFIDRLGHCRLVLPQLLQSLLEVGIGIA